MNEAEVKLLKNIDTRTAEMRQRQRAYFKNRLPEDLNASRILERNVDDLLQQYKDGVALQTQDMFSEVTP